MSTPNRRQFRQDEIDRMTPIASQVVQMLGASTGNSREDADNLNNLSRELLHVRATVVEVQYPELRGMVFLPPADERLDPGASHYTYNYTDRSGKSRMAGAMPVGNIPRADVKTEQATPVEFQSMVLAYGFNLQELRASVMARRPLPMQKADATRKIMAQDHDDIILIGDGTADFKYLTGLFKQPIAGANAVATYTVPNGDAGSKTWELKTAAEIVADLHGLCNAVQLGTNGVEIPNLVGLPLTSYTVASTRRMGDGNSDSALDFFINQRQKMTGGAFQGVEPSVKLETAGATATKRAIAYVRGGGKSFRADSVEFEQMPPQIVGFDTVTNCHSRTAGCIVPFTKSIAYGDGI